MFALSARDLASKLTLAEIREVEREKLVMLAEQNAAAEERARKKQEELDKAAAELAKTREEIAAGMEDADKGLEATVTLRHAATQQTFFALPPIPEGKGGLAKPGTKTLYAWADRIAQNARAQMNHG